MSRKKCRRPSGHKNKVYANSRTSEGVSIWIQSSSDSDIETVFDDNTIGRNHLNYFLSSSLRNNEFSGSTEESFNSREGRKTKIRHELGISMQDTRLNTPFRGHPVSTDFVRG